MKAFSFVKKIFASKNRRTEDEEREEHEEEREEQEEEKEESEEDSSTITLSPPSSFNRNGHLFNKEDTFSDLDFIIAGLEKPLKLHRNILSQTSMLVEGILKAKQESKNADFNEIEWVFDTSNEVDREALVKVLRFCYGDTITVDVDNGECCAVIAALFRLQVICAVDTVAKLSKFAIEQAQANLRVGVELLMATQQYPECSNINFCALDEKLGEIVLSKERMQEDHDIVVDGCLMRLPPRFLDIAHFGESHTKWSEFTVRARYVRYHSDSLSQKEKEAIVKKCDWNTLMSSELNQLNQLGFVDQDTIMRTYHSALECMWIERNEWHLRAIKAENDRDALHELLNREEKSQKCELMEQIERAEKGREEDRRTIKRLENTTQRLGTTIRLLLSDFQRRRYQDMLSWLHGSQITFQWSCKWKEQTKTGSSTHK